MDTHEAILSYFQQLPFKTLQTLICKAISKSENENSEFGLVSHDAIYAFNRCASLFVLYIATASQRNALLNKRKVVTEDDTIKGLEDCCFYPILSKLASQNERDFSQF